MFGDMRQRLVHERTLHLRRERPGFFVDRDDPPRVQDLGLAGDSRLVALLVVFPLALDDFVLRVLQLQAV